jgi:hypothetical protein
MTKLIDSILDLMEDIVSGVLGACSILGVCIIGICFIITLPLWIIPYGFIKRRRNNGKRRGA